MSQFIANASADPRGLFVASIVDADTHVTYRIDPLGSPYSFQRRETALQLAERHAATANRRGPAALPNLTRLG